MLIIGLGNPDRGDDVAGILVARGLAERGIETVQHRGGTLDLIEIWDAASCAVVVDAVLSSAAPPGTVHIWDALIELAGTGEHRFLVQVGSEAGREVLGELEHWEASEEDGRLAQAAVDGAAAAQVRHMDTTDIRELLYSNFEHPRWDNVAERCLACTNCTLVCPTCFWIPASLWISHTSTEVTYGRPPRRGIGNG